MNEEEKKERLANWLAARFQQKSQIKNDLFNALLFSIPSIHVRQLLQWLHKREIIIAQRGITKCRHSSVFSSLILAKKMKQMRFFVDLLLLFMPQTHDDDDDEIVVTIACLKRASKKRQEEEDNGSYPKHWFNRFASVYLRPTSNKSKESKNVQRKKENSRHNEWKWNYFVVLFHIAYIYYLPTFCRSFDLDNFWTSYQDVIQWLCEESRPCKIVKWSSLCNLNNYCISSFFLLYSSCVE